MSKRGGDSTRISATKVKKRKGVGSRTITIPDSDEEGPLPTPSNDYARVTKTRVGSSGKVETISTKSVFIFEADESSAPAEENVDDSVGVVVTDVIHTVPAKQRKRANDSVSSHPINPSLLLRTLQTKMHSWINMRLDVLDEIVNCDSPGIQQLDLCSSCSNQQPTLLYRCLECLYPSLHCIECIIKQHKMLPLHHLEVCLFFQCTTNVGLMFYPALAERVL